MTFGKSASMKLKEAVDDFLDLDTDPGRYLMSDRGGRRHTKEDDSTDERKEQETKGSPKDSQTGSRVRRVFRKL